MLLPCVCSGKGEGEGGPPSVFSSKSKLKLKPVKDSSAGMLSRAPEPAGNKLLAARVTVQGDKTSFSASSAGRWDAPGGGGRWRWPRGEGEAELAENPWPGVVSLLRVPSTLTASGDGQGLAGKGLDVV